MVDRCFEVLQLRLDLVHAALVLGAANIPVITNPEFEAKIERDAAGKFTDKAAGSTASSSVTRALKSITDSSTPVGKGAQKIITGEPLDKAITAVSTQVFKLEAAPEVLSKGFEWGKEVVVHEIFDHTLKSLNRGIKEIRAVKTPAEAVGALGKLAKQAAPAIASFLLLGVAPEVLMGASIGVAFETAAIQIGVSTLVQRGVDKMLDTLQVEDPMKRLLVSLATIAMTGSVVRSGIKAVNPAIAKQLKEVQRAYDQNQAFLKQEMNLVEQLREHDASQAEIESVLKQMQGHYEANIDAQTQLALARFAH